MMNTLTEEFTKLVEIDSVSFKERRMADYIKQRLEGLGLKPCEDDTGSRIGGETGNVYASFFNEGSSGEDAVLFCAHMDTVEPGLGKKAVIHEDGRITSRGDTVLGADDLTGVAVILEAVRLIKEEGVPHRDIELLFPVAEEPYTAGTSAADLSYLRSRRAYVLDNSGEPGLYSATEPTIIEFEIEIKGRASHAGFEPEKGVNSIVIFSNAMSALKVGRVDEETTLNIGTISGGTAANIVPDSLKLKGEIRSHVHKKALEQLDKVIDTFNTQASVLGGEALEDHKIKLYAYEVPESSEALKAYKKVLDKLGIKMTAKRSFGGSDNNVLRRIGIDGICIANAMHNVHSVNEYTETDEMEQVLKITKLLMTERL